MIDDLIQRLDLFSSDPVLGGVIEEAKGRIEQIEAENAALRRTLAKANKMLVDLLDWLKGY